MNACEHNRAESAKVLLEYGAAVDLCNARQQTALHISCIHDADECTTLLMGRNASVTMEDNLGNLLLYSGVVY